MKIIKNIWLLPMREEEDVIKDAELHIKGDTIVYAGPASHAPRVQAVSYTHLNGIKYTPPEGSVTVEVEEQSQFIIITVSDTGIGIPQEEQAHVFERFYRVDRARARDTGGTAVAYTHLDVYKRQS